LAGCYPWAIKEEHRLKLSAPASVPRDGFFTFSVEIAGPDGEPAKHLRYGWLIDWPEARGIMHTGVSSEPQTMGVKGGPGKATLRLYVNDAAGHHTQIDRYEFKVE
jgi:hypothetical protein